MTFGLAVAISLKGEPHYFAMGWPRRGRPPGDAGDPVRDRLGEQDLHRHPSRLCLAQDRCASTTAPASTGRHCRAAARRHPACSTSRPIPPAACRYQFPTRCRRTAQIRDYYRQWQPTYAPGSQRLYSSEHRPVRLSRRAQPGPAVRTTHGARCSRHWARTDPPRRALRRRWRSTPGATARTTARYGSVPAAGCRRLRGEDQRGRPAALRRCQPASGAPGQALGAGARCHPSRLLQGRRHDPRAWAGKPTTGRSP